MRKRISPLNNIRLSLVRTKVIYQISTKIPRKRMQKRTFQDGTSKGKKKKKRNVFTPLLLFLVVSSERRSRVKSDPVHAKGTATIRWQRGMKRGPRRALMNFTRYCARTVSPRQELMPIRPDHRANFAPGSEIVAFPRRVSLPRNWADQSVRQTSSFNLENFLPTRQINMFNRIISIL